MHIEISGAGLAGLTAADLPQGVAAGGPVGLIQAMGDEDRLLFA